MNIIKAWNKAKDGQKIWRIHSEIGRTELTKRKFYSLCEAHPALKGLTYESFTADDWQIAKEKEFTVPAGIYKGAIGGYWISHVFVGADGKCTTTASSKPLCTALVTFKWTEEEEEE